MGALTEQQEGRLADARGFLAQRTKQFASVLPSHIKPERFLRTVMTALTMQPKLLNAPVDVLLNECMRAAQDGLMPDGKEAALVPRYGKEFTISYQPMIAGIRKKARNSGEISTWDVRAVRENDSFDFGYGLNPFLEHHYDIRKPRGDLVAVYSVCVLKDGTKSFDVMSIEDVNRIRDKSDGWKAFQNKKISTTPWADHYEEMARKTVARRHAKELPTSTDLDRLLYQGADDDRVIDYGDLTAAAPQPKSLEHRLDDLGKDEDGDVIDGETGEIVKDGTDGGDEGEQSQSDPMADARAAGIEAKRKGMSKRSMPAAYRREGAEDLAQAFSEGFDSTDA